MKSVIYTLSGALVALALSAGAPDAWAQHHGGGGGGGGGARTPSGGSSGGGGTAVSRGSGGSSGGGHVSGSGGSTRPSGSGGTRATSSAPASSGGAAVARPRDGGRPNYGNPVVGRAVQRPYGGYGYPGGYYPGYGHNYWYYPYNPYYLYGYGAFGLGAFYYDPFWWGYGYPYGWGYPGYYGGGGGYYGGYDAGGSAGSYDAPQQADEGPKGGLKLKIQPSNAQVFVDGAYVGVVDEFNSAFQRLSLPAGTHRIEVRANGFQALSFDVRIEPRVTTSYSATLQPAR